MKLILNILALCALSIAPCFAEAPEQVTATLSAPERESLTWAVAQANATAQKAHEQAQAAKPEKERAAFVPITEEAYLRARVAQILASYGEQMITERTKENAELIRKAVSLPKAAQEALKALIEKAGQ